MYIESSSPRMVNEVANIYSPKLSPGTYCTSYWYHMWGSGMGDIKVYTLESGKEGTYGRKVLQSYLTGNIGNAWGKDEFEFQTNANIENVQVLFSGIIGPSFTSDAAIDDISIITGPCSKFF